MLQSQNARKLDLCLENASDLHHFFLTVAHNPEGLNKNVETSPDNMIQSQPATRKSQLGAPRKCHGRIQRAIHQDNLKSQLFLLIPGTFPIFTQFGSLVSGELVGRSFIFKANLE